MGKNTIKQLNVTRKQRVVVEEMVDSFSVCLYRGEELIVRAHHNQERESVGKDLAPFFEAIGLDMTIEEDC
jgi:hypothetical protein